jgi:hypothetical protein
LAALQARPLTRTFVRTGELRINSWSLNLFQSEAKLFWEYTLFKNRSGVTSESSLEGRGGTEDPELFKKATQSEKPKRGKDDGWRAQEEPIEETKQ